MSNAASPLMCITKDARQTGFSKSDHSKRRVVPSKLALAVRLMMLLVVAIHDIKSFMSLCPVGEGATSRGYPVGLVGYQTGKVNFAQLHKPLPTGLRLAGLNSCRTGS